MSFNEPIRQSSDLLLSCQETIFRSAQENAMRSSTPSAMSTTTFTDATLAAAGDCIGCWAIPEDGNARDQPRRILSVAANVFTVDLAWNNIANVTRIRIWQAADVPVRGSGAGSTTTVVAAGHGSSADANAVDDYWVRKGYFLIGLAGGNAGKARKITAFTAASGTFTVPTAWTSSVADDLHLLAHMVRPEGQLSIQANPGFLKRTIVGFVNADVPSKTTYAGTIPLDLPVRPMQAAGGASGSGPSTGVLAIGPMEMRNYLTDHFTEEADTGAKAAAGSGSNIINAATGEASRFSVGNLLLAPTGEVCLILAIATDAISVPAGHLATTGNDIPAGAVLNASVSYTRKRTNFLTRTFHYWRGSAMYQCFQGCMPTMSVEIARDQLVRFKLSYNAGEVYEYNLPRPVSFTAAAADRISLLDTTVPRDVKGNRAVFNGTKVRIQKFTLNWGLAPKMRNTIVGQNNTDGMMMELQPMTGSFSILADEDQLSSFEDLVDRLQRRVPTDFLYQKGSNAGETWGLSIPALTLTKSMENYQEGMGVYECEFECVEPQLAGLASNIEAAIMGWM